MGTIKGIGLYGGDFPVIKTNTALVKENISRLLLTVPGEDVGNLEFGCTLRNMLFNFTYILTEEIEQIIVTAITKWEPRVRILDIKVWEDEEMRDVFHVTINLVLLETLEEFNMELPVTF